MKTLEQMKDEFIREINSGSYSDFFVEAKLNALIEKAKEDMFLNMQYYMEYCQMKGYVTPQEWLEKYKHF